MAEKKKKAIEKDKKTKPSAEAKKNELSDEDLKKAAGGAHDTHELEDKLKQ
jgi:hypothetical protein